MRPPDWMIYAGLIGAAVIFSLMSGENADAPPAPRPPDQVEEALLGPLTPFDPAATVHAPGPFRPTAGTAFSVAGEGRWLTARHVVEGCRQPALVVGGGRAVAADLRLASRADMAVLITQGGPDALPVSSEPPVKGQRAFHPGYPQGRAGEVASRFLGREIFRLHRRGDRGEPVLVWAEVGRTTGLQGRLSGLSGAPVLDDRGQVMGVTIAAAPRRGRLYTTAPETFLPVARDVKEGGADPLPSRISVANYGRVSDDLRRDLRIAQVVCLAT